MNAILIALSLTACSDNNLDDLGDASSTPPGEVEPGTLRIDVHPAADALDLLAQSFVMAPETYEDQQIRHQLSAAVAISGTLLAESMQGLGVAASSLGPLDAVVLASRSGLIQGGGSKTDAEGSFSFLLPGRQPYSISIVPQDPTLSPLLLLASEAVEDGLVLDQTLSSGAPVYGRVTDAAGLELGNVSLRVSRADVELQSATFTTSSNGWFVARVEPGYDYWIETVGDALAEGGPIPSVKVPFFVDDLTGAEVNLDLGNRTAVEIRGRVLHPQGEKRFEFGPHVRATSGPLATGTLVVEIDAQSDGRFELPLLPGDWTLEVWPSSDLLEYTPWVHSATVKSSLDIGDIKFLSPTELSGTLTDASGNPATGVTVTALEVGYGEYSFSATTDRDGVYAMRVPRTEVRLQAVPPTPAAGAYFHQVLDLRQADLTLDHPLTLVPGSEVRGVAMLDDAPVPFAMIEVYDHAEGWLLARSMTDATGAYNVRVDLPSGSLLEDADTAGDTGSDTGLDTGS